MLGRKKPNKNRNRRKRQPQRALDVTWQVIGMITIIVIMTTLAFGDSPHASNLAEENFIGKSFSEALASFNLRSR